MQQVSQQRLTSLKKAFRMGKMLACVVIGLVGVLFLGGSPQINQGLEAQATEVATGSTWHNASFPVENFQTYTSPFGYRRSVTGEVSQEFHYGLDLAAPEGSYVRNWWSGQIVEVIGDSRCGTGLVIQSGAWEHIYCHMQGTAQVNNGRRYLVDRTGGILIQEGQEIPAGARIGRVGMTGRSTGPHLHWGLRYSNQWVDPALVLRAMYSQQGPQVSTRPER